MPGQIDGGSSAGSAAAVASGMRAAGAGHRHRWIDPYSGGVVRSGRLRHRLPGGAKAEGVFPPSSSSTTLGSIANHVEDARLLFEVVAGRACVDGQPSTVAGWLITTRQVGPA